MPTSTAPRRLRLLAALLGLLAGAAQAGTQWYAVYLDGTRIGHMSHQREVRGDTVETRSDIHLQLSRNGEPMAIDSSETSIEDVNGRPIGFASRLDGANLQSNVLATVAADGQVEAVIDRAGRREVQRLRWPEAAVMAEGERIALARILAEPGARLRLRSFDNSALRALQVEHQVLERGEVVLPEGTETLVHVRQTIDGGDGAIVADYWRREGDAEVRRARIPALGLQLDLQACSRRCAEQAPEGADVLQRALTPSPRPLGLRERQSPLRFHLATGDAPTAGLAAIPGQYLRRDGAHGLRLWLDPAGDARLPPTAADTRPSRWLQSEDAAIRAFAQQAVADVRTPARQLPRLEQAVRRHIRSKSLRIGYASAKEALELAEGDCTEHAVLLAASARALGIPARVVTGLAYAPSFGARNDVFVPHAWVIAWIDGRWRGYDAALPRFDATHIGLAAGDGDPFDFYAGMDLLGKLRISAIERVRAGDVAALRQTAESRP